MLSTTQFVEGKTFLRWVRLGLHNGDRALRLGRLGGRALRLGRLGGRALRLEQAMGPNAAARAGYRGPSLVLQLEQIRGPSAVAQVG